MIQWIIVVSLLISTDILLAAKKTLSLGEAVKSAIRNNFVVQNNDEGKEITKNALKYQRIGIFVPSVRLEGNYTFKNTLTQKKFSDGYYNNPIEPDPSLKYDDYKEAYIQVVMDDINLFNSFDDKRYYDYIKKSFDNEIISLNNDSRRFFLDLIHSYYRSYASEVRLQDAERRYKIALSLYDLSKTMKKIKGRRSLDLDYFESGYLEAKAVLTDSRIYHRENIRELKSYIIENIDDTTKLTTDFTVKTKDLNLQDLLRQVRNAPGIKYAENDVAITKNDLTQTKVNYMPKLSVSVSGATVGRRYNPDGTSYNIRTYDAFEPSENINLTAAINLSIPLFGKETGVLNSVEYKRRILAHKRAKDLYMKTKRDMLDFIRQSYYSVKESEEALVYAKRRLNNDSKILNKMIRKYTNNEVERDQLRESLENSFNSMSDLLQNKLNYLSLRKGIASELGDIKYLGVDLKKTITRSIIKHLR